MTVACTQQFSLHQNKHPRQKGTILQQLLHIDLSTTSGHIGYHSKCEGPSTMAFPGCLSPGSKYNGIQERKRLPRHTCMRRRWEVCL